MERWEDTLVYVNENKRNVLFELEKKNIQMIWAKNLKNIDLSMYEYKHVENIQTLIFLIIYFLYNPDF